MKRFFLSLVCCSPLLFSPSISHSIDLIGPSDESALAYEQYGPISPVETLWAISAKLRPDTSVSVQQTMVAIYKANPFAFYKGNINKIIPESIIKVPSLEFVAQQTDKEAIALIKKYSANQALVTRPKKALSAVKIEKVAVVDAVPEVRVDPAIIAENELNKANLIETDKKRLQLQEEVLSLNEQFIIATEETQALKMKLQIIQDEVVTLSAQLEEEALVQGKLQQIIDDYRNQLDAIEEPAFSGDGMFNELLRLITSSLTNLLIVIISPVLLLLLIGVVIYRILIKRQLAEREQELAESTAMLMEESGQFDSLLTDDYVEEDQELDFTDDEPETVNIDDELLTTPDPLAPIDLSVDEERQTNEDDPFGIGALTDDEELISSIDLDDMETNEDDPFGIGALTDDEELISSVDLDDIETSEDDPFGIAALTEDKSTSSTELDQGKKITPEQQADLDLAAEWEAQVSAEAAVKIDDAVEEKESDFDLSTASDDFSVEFDTTSSELLSSDELSELDQLESGLTLNLDDNAVENEVKTSDKDELDSLVLEVKEEDNGLDFDALDLTELDLDSADEITDLDFTDLEDELPALDQLANDESDQLDFDALDLTELDLDSTDEITDLDFTDLEAIKESPDSGESLSETNIERLLENENNDKDQANDLLAKQLSNVAFNETESLPPLDHSEDGFIDIETLLANSNTKDNEEPYGELDLDLGLDEFPDVVDLQNNIDIDDDENGIGAQLDLARAYLEIDDKEGAKEILLAVVENSNGKQRAEIDKLLSRLG